MITAKLQSAITDLARFLRARSIFRKLRNEGPERVTIQHRALLNDRMTSKTL